MSTGFTAQNEPSNLMEIVVEWLNMFGFDGLEDDYGCHCPKEDILRCGEPSINCKPYKGKREEKI